tara:strand:+ start:735 stop:1286 length:552 start_codon:yes stop_codon:yes gene_type:complete
MLIIKQGQLLISEPSLNDPAFFKSVVLLTHHNKEESIGLVLNNATKILLNEIFNNIPQGDFPVYIGGPVANDSIHFIHTLGQMIPGSIKITHDLYFGGEFKKIIELMSKNKISKREIRFFSGYSGWNTKQLEKEIKNNDWIIQKYNKKICMKYSSKELWSMLIRTKKSKYAIWANMPKDPSMN